MFCLAKRFAISSAIAAADGYCRTGTSPINCGLSFGTLCVIHKVANQLIFKGICKANEHLNLSDSTIKVLHIATGDVTFLGILGISLATRILSAPTAYIGGAFITYHMARSLSKEIGVHLR